VKNLLLIAGLLALAGCRAPEAEPEKFAIEKRYEAEPVEVTLKVNRDQVTVADTVEVTLEAVAPEGESLRFPDLSGKLGDFTVLGSSESAPLLVGENRVVRRRVYELEPFLPGDYTVPELSVGFGEGGSIETESVTVVVASVLPEGAENPDIKDITPPVSLPGLDPWIYAAIAALLAGLGFLFWWKRRRKEEFVATAPQPHEIALRALRELMAEDLIAQGKAKLFYLRVSGILRHYIEGRFGLHAPESTTEEFLHDLSADQSFNDRQKELLREFLMHCDMVKFAEYEPAGSEIDETINTCAQFIAETRPAEAVSGAPSEGTS
jgi:LPXTG-motif cell wall-anchored protein